jgi:hypothetical protein
MEYPVASPSSAQAKLNREAPTVFSDGKAMMTGELSTRELEKTQKKRNSITSLFPERIILMSLRMPARSLS